MPSEWQSVAQWRPHLRAREYHKLGTKLFRENLVGSLKRCDFTCVVTCYWFPFHFYSYPLAQPDSVSSSNPFALPAANKPSFLALVLVPSAWMISKQPSSGFIFCFLVHPSRTSRRNDFGRKIWNVWNETVNKDMNVAILASQFFFVRKSALHRRLEQVQVSARLLLPHSAHTRAKLMATSIATRW